MKPNCDICMGRGIIRLPVYRKMAVAPSGGGETLPLPRSREYPCPECGGQVGLERVAVLEAHSMVTIQLTEAPGFIEHVQTRAAHMLVDLLLKDGYVTFEYGKQDDRTMTQPMVASLGVVSRGAVASLEARVAERQSQLARAVADEAVKQINNWGSYYGHYGIHKDDATRLIREAVTAVNRTWTKADQK